MVSVPDRSADTLLPLIQQWILPETRIISDGWTAYGGIRNLQQQYNHQWVNHRLYFVDPTDRSVHTQGIEATWGAIKRAMKHLSGTSPELFPTYLFQYMFRRFFNRKQLALQLLREIRFQYPVWFSACYPVVNYPLLLLSLAILVSYKLFFWYFSAALMCFPAVSVFLCCSAVFPGCFCVSLLLRCVSRLFLCFSAALLCFSVAFVCFSL